MSLIDEHVDDVMGKVDADREDVKQSFEDLICHGIPAQEAKQSVARMYAGGDDG